MTACNQLHRLLIGLILVGLSALANAESAATAPATTGTAAVDPGSAASKTVTHKLSHRKKKSVANDDADATTGAETADATGANTGSTSHKKSSRSKTKTPSTTASAHAKPAPADTASGPLNAFTPEAAAANAPITITKLPSDVRTPITVSAPTDSTPNRPGAGPEVETGLPVARRSGHDSATGVGVERAGTYQMASSFPIPAGEATIGSYTPPRHVKSPVDNFTFTNFTRRSRNTYPWKLDIITTVFWIGEVAPNQISTTKNIDSAWKEDWRSSNGGTDTPDARRGYMPAHHAAQENPFYVALPFNDLACPDKARRWLPANWVKPSKDGKQVSACKDRWIEIKNAQGETCYAQWEDVGPLRYDHAEYVFGNDRPNTFTRAGLDVSPAVADYLNITGKNRLTRWRFVDDADVQPGMWLKYDEEALIYKAMHSLKDDRSHILPIQQATAPIHDDDDIISTKKKIGAAKG